MSTPCSAFCCVCVCVCATTLGLRFTGFTVLKIPICFFPTSTASDSPRLLPCREHHQCCLIFSLPAFPSPPPKDDYHQFALVGTYFVIFLFFLILLYYFPL